MSPPHVRRNRRPSRWPRPQYLAFQAKFAVFIAPWIVRSRERAIRSRERLVHSGQRAIRSLERAIRCRFSACAITNQTAFAPQSTNFEGKRREFHRRGHGERINHESRRTYKGANNQLVRIREELWQRSGQIRRPNEKRLQAKRPQPLLDLV